MSIRKKISLMLSLLIVLGTICSGCTQTDDKMVKIKDLEFTVIAEDRLPEELKTAIMEKKETEFKITYCDNDYLYICVGYGRQNTGGYSITVNDLYLTENAIYVDTNLIGPKPEEAPKEVESFPYIVVKLENMDKTVVFD